MDRIITQPVMPREIDLKEPMWYVVSEKNIDEFHDRLTKEHGQIVFVAMSIPDYELMSYNCLLYTSPSPRDKRQSRMPSSA